MSGKFLEQCCFKRATHPNTLFPVDTLFWTELNADTFGTNVFCKVLSAFPVALLELRLLWLLVPPFMVLTLALLLVLLLVFTLVVILDGLFRLIVVIDWFALEELFCRCDDRESLGLLISKRKHENGNFVNRC